MCSAHRKQPLRTIGPDGSLGGCCCCGGFCETARSAGASETSANKKRAGLNASPDVCTPFLACLIEVRQLDGAALQRPMIHTPAELGRVDGPDIRIGPAPIIVELGARICRAQENQHHPTTRSVHSTDFLRLRLCLLLPLFWRRASDRRSGGATTSSLAARRVLDAGTGKPFSTRHLVSPVTSL